MTADPGDAPLDELAALYAAGALPPAEARAFEAGLTAGSAAAGVDAAVLALTADVPPVEPPPWLKAELLAKLPPDPASSGLTFRFRDAGRFDPIPGAPGTYARVLHVDRRRKQFTAVLRMDPGAKYPGHHHDGAEECLVLEGELLVGDVRLRAGDYQRAEPGSDHVEQWTDVGAVLFVTAPISLLAG
jgi:quercetin dioxygenase-like cupin family protein